MSSCGKGKTYDISIWQCRAWCRELLSSTELSFSVYVAYQGQLAVRSAVWQRGNLLVIFKQKCSRNLLCCSSADFWTNIWPQMWQQLTTNHQPCVFLLSLKTTYYSLHSLLRLWALPKIAPKQTLGLLQSNFDALSAPAVRGIWVHFPSICVFGIHIEKT